MNSLRLLVFQFYPLFIFLQSFSTSPHKIPRLSPFHKEAHILRKYYDGSSLNYSSEDLKNYYYTQTIDHFNYAPQSYANFRQKYVVSSKYWGGPNSESPILAYLGAEDPLDEDLPIIGFLRENAPHFKSLSVYIEHRFYGESIPFGTMEEVMKNETIRGYFNSAQAIADYAEILLHVKKQFSAHNSPIIVVGGSYGGELAAWFRLKYPHIAVGAVASSSPILYLDNITPQNGYYSTVTKDFKVSSKYLDHLIVKRKYAEAASCCPKLLRGSASAWERWVFQFAHLRQLPVLVPYIPTENPRLRDTAYEIALVALASNPSFHKDLLSILRTWPHNIYSAVPVISAIEPQLNTSSSTDALQEALAELYVINGEYEKAFSLYADLMKPDLFDFIDKHNLHDGIREKVAQLMMIDCKRAVPLFIQHRDIISSSDVVSQLIAAKNKCDYRHFLHLYLHSLFESNPHAGRDYHDMQVELYVDYDPKMLLIFLRSSQHYTLEKAYEICVRRGLLREQVFILGRMGNAKQALAVIINKLGDIEEAIEFVSNQHDDELWEELIKQCMDKPEMVGVLLEHTVGNLDPLYIVNRVPNGLEIPRLRDRLVKIITDYRTETSLRHGCNDILKADCVNLLIKCYKEARRAIHLSNEEDETHNKRDNKNGVSQPAERSLTIKTTEVKSRSRCGARCCICFDPFSIQDVSIYAFFCCHAYHETCLEDSLASISSEKKPATSPPQDELSYYSFDNGDDKDVNDVNDDGDRKRCILCTTAAC